MRWRTKTTRKVNDFLSCCTAKKKENDLIFFCFRPPPPKSYTRPEPVRGEYSSSYVSGISHTGCIQSFSTPMCSEATSSCGDVLVPASFNCENLKKKTSKADAHSQGGHIVISIVSLIISVITIIITILNRTGKRRGFMTWREKPGTTTQWTARFRFTLIMFWILVMRS